jgi:hypothetical protein
VVVWAAWVEWVGWICNLIGGVSGVSAICEFDDLRFIASKKKSLAEYCGAFFIHSLSLMVVDGIKRGKDSSRISIVVSPDSELAHFFNIGGKTAPLD